LQSAACDRQPIDEKEQGTGHRALLKLPPDGFFNPSARFTEAMQPV
jgi:hypothetical protein